MEFQQFSQAGSNNSQSSRPKKKTAQSDVMQSQPSFLDNRVKSVYEK